MRKSVKNSVAEALHRNSIKPMKNVQKGKSVSARGEDRLEITGVEDAGKECENR